ncbi:Broad specificity phosphatase PhoE [Streptomyces sp. 1222.5]|uniref:histidine phosphatase family protein n=1 Tax=unclassified Streptomyces TaxID=2593676 RepID=UPI00089AF291|nr:MULTISPECIES: histidine phosphatase family protein [unclassified Streptomyces]PKW12291.1 broad specificity phosphatase PhoE [Streptomyces sp. 5112.2]SEB58995.1 Broad specificity phosphatase PhoE [Streptomyces sp. 1222.5]SEE35519.1 Broad specificity phosphatase PhoE [Streptomyces sp. 2231.1]
MAAHTPVRLTVRRHAESVWNAQARIQGDIASPPLTAAGAAEAEQWAAGLPDDAGIRTIWSSDAVRARSTAAAAGRRLGLPVTSTRLLAEAGAGVLEGLTHAEAARTLPEHHRVWKARGDLDAIPGAESGDRLQARAIAFLTAATGPGGAELYGGTQLVVSHAAFLRCLVNTAQRRPRTTPVAIGHGDTHLLTDPWTALRPERLNQLWRPAAHRVSPGPDGDAGPAPRFVVKLVPGLGADGRLDRYATVQHAVSTATGTPPLLAAATRGDGSAVTVRRFVPGATLGHHLGSDEEWELLGFYERFNTRLGAAVEAEALTGVRSLGDRIDIALRGPDNEAVRELRTLTGDRGLRALFYDRSRVADFDLHRDNTLRTDTGQLLRIDLDSLCPGPPRLGEACALVGASALYSAGRSASSHERPHARRLGGDSDHARELRHLVRVRLLLGLWFFLAAPGAAGTAGSERHAALYRAALTELTALDQEKGNCTR